VVHLITLAHVQDVMLAQINPTALIIVLETHFGRVQISANELAIAKYCQKEWRRKAVDQVAARLISNRGLSTNVAINKDRLIASTIEKRWNDATQRMTDLEAELAPGQCPVSQTNRSSKFYACARNTGRKKRPSIRCPRQASPSRCSAVGLSDLYWCGRFRARHGHT
jgi:hypothetical protein